MQANATLQAVIAGRIQALSSTLATQPDGRVEVNESFPVEIENGESIVGYQYLHGTNADVGDFRIVGTATISRGAGAPGAGDPAPGPAAPPPAVQPAAGPAARPVAPVAPSRRAAAAPAIPQAPQRDRSVEPTTAPPAAAPATAGSAAPPALVTFDVEYQWNDIIDPNPQYSTDNWKSAFAEIITLGMAEGYTISIRWRSGSSVAVDASGSPGPVSGGWPGSP